MKVSLRLPALAALAVTGLTVPALAAPAAASAPARTTAAAGGAVAAARAVRARTPVAPGGSQLWEARFGKGLGFGSRGAATAVSPKGSTVFVAGQVLRAGSSGVGEIVAYKAATGAVIWKRQYSPSPTGRSDFYSIVVSPDGSTVFVTGDTQPRQGGHFTYLTIAYNAVTGATLWVDRGQIRGSADAVTVSPDGSTVFVTGSGVVKQLNPPPTNTVAYNAATGATLWTQSAAAIIAMAIAVSPDGSAVFVTGVPENSGSGPTTIGISAATGATLWTQTGGVSWGHSVAVAPDGSAVFVTGSGTSGFPTTTAFSVTTGAVLWTQQSKVPPSQLAVSPGGSTVFVIGTSSTLIKKQLIPVYVTTAYNAATGARLWQARYRDGNARAIAVSPDGSKVFVTGSIFNASNTRNGYGTVAYNAATGTQLWAARQTVATSGPNLGGGTSAGVSPNGSTVFVTGYLWPSGADPDMVTVAYNS